MKRLPTLLGSVKYAFTLAILLLVVARTTAQTEVTLPAPTGPRKIGRTSFDWKDSARDELETSAPDDKRELVVHLLGNIFGEPESTIQLDSLLLRTPLE